MSGSTHINHLLEPFVNLVFRGEEPVPEISKSLLTMIDNQSQRLHSQTDFSTLITKLQISGAELIMHDTKDTRYKIAGIMILDCLLTINDEIVPDRRTDIANQLRKVLSIEKPSLEVNASILTAAAAAIGRFGKIANSTEIEFLQNFYVGAALKWMAEMKSECHRFAGIQLIIQLSINLPAIVFAKRKSFFSAIWETTSDKHSLIRQAGGVALGEALRLIAHRENIGDYLRLALRQAESGFSVSSNERILSSLLILSIITDGGIVPNSELHHAIRLHNFSLPSLIWKSLQKKDSKDPEIRSKTIQIIPRLASAFSTAFVTPNTYTEGTNFLGLSIKFLLATIKQKKDRQVAYLALGKLFQAMANSIRTMNVVPKQVFPVLDEGFRPLPNNQSPLCVEGLQCLEMIVSMTPIVSRKCINTDLINNIFLGGLTVELINTLKVIMKYIPTVRSQVQYNLRYYISKILSSYSIIVDDGMYSRTQIRRSAVGSIVDTMTSGIATPAASPATTTRKGTFSNIFGGSNTATASSETNSDGNAANGDSSDSSGNISTDAQLELAINTLASYEFFPKFARLEDKDKQVSSNNSKHQSTGSRTDAMAFISETASMSNITENTEDQNPYLLRIVHDNVIHFVDDSNASLRLAAAMTSITVIDKVCVSSELSEATINDIRSVIDRLLMLGVGDENLEIRSKVFAQLTPSLDYMIAQSESVHCVIEALNDGSIEVRASAMSVLCRIAHYDQVHIMPLVRLGLKRLMRRLLASKDHIIRKDSVTLLQSMVRGSNTLIMPYVDQVLEPLLLLLKDPSSSIVGAALSTIGELSIVSPLQVRACLEEIFPFLINALVDTNSISTQEIAVVVLGRLVTSLDVITDPYTKYPTVFQGLMVAIQNANEGATELRMQAIKTAGLLGTVNEEFYNNYLQSVAIQRENNTNVKVLSITGVDLNDRRNRENQDCSDEDDAQLSTNTLSINKLEKYYIDNIISSLVDVLRDSSLSAYHSIAAAVSVRIVRIIGPQNYTDPLDNLIDGLVSRIYLGNNLQDSLMEHLISIIHIIGRRIMKFRDILVKLFCDFFDTRLQHCLDIMLALSVVLSPQNFNIAGREMLPLLLQCIRIEPTENEDQRFVDIGVLNAPINNPTTEKLVLPKTRRILQTLCNMATHLGELRFQILSVVQSLLQSTDAVPETVRCGICTVIHLAKSSDKAELTTAFSLIIHQLMSIISGDEVSLHSTATAALAFMVCKLKAEFVPYILPIRRRIRAYSMANNSFDKSSQLLEYESLVLKLLKRRSLPDQPACMSDLHIIRGTSDSGKHRNPSNLSKESLPVSIAAIESAWSLSGRTTSADLTGWLERVTVEFIRQSPSPIVRHCAVLANSYRPLAEQLFNASFMSLWNEVLSSQVTNLSSVTEDSSLMDCLETALQSPEIPPSTLHILLNLAEFMDMQDKPLPLDTVIVAKQAENFQMFAKCLRYRENEFLSKNCDPTSECIEALIMVNDQLGLHDAAVGVLHCVQSKYPHITIQPLWFEKLSRWPDAKISYETAIKSWKSAHNGDTAPQHSHWMSCELGLMRCLLSLGEFEQLSMKAQALKDQLKVANEQHSDYPAWFTETQKLGANAAWMLGKWDLMEDFLEGETVSQMDQNVFLDNNTNFYRAVLAIHKEDYLRASSLISDTRATLADSYSSLMSRSYNGAFYAMVSMQVLSEMEEVIEYKQDVARVHMELIDPFNTKSKSKSDGKSTIPRSRPSAAHQLNVGLTGNVTQQNLRCELATKKTDLLKKWHGRLKWAPRDIKVYRQILAVHTLVVEPIEDLDSWLHLVHLCRKAGLENLCEKMLRRLGAVILPQGGCLEDILSLDEHMTYMRERSSSVVSAGSINSSPCMSMMSDDYEPCVLSVFPPTNRHRVALPNSRVCLSAYKYLWKSGDRRRAFDDLNFFINTLPDADPGPTEDNLFKAHCILKKADWMARLHGQNYSVGEVIATVKQAREVVPEHYSVWHAWAVVNFYQLQGNSDRSQSCKSTEDNTETSAKDNNVPFSSRVDSGSSTKTSFVDMFRSSKSKKKNNTSINSTKDRKSSIALSSFRQVSDGPTASFAAEAIRGFIRSIIFGEKQSAADTLQDTLRLLTLWFSYGTKESVYQILNVELEDVAVEKWLAVIPQLIARMHVKAPEISGLLRRILIKVADMHPQALVCPISVAFNTTGLQQRLVAGLVIREMRKKSSQLVEEATMLSRELMRVAMTPHELWHDGLEKAAQCYVAEKNITGMLQALDELHESIDDVVYPAVLESGSFDPLTPSPGTGPPSPGSPFPRGPPLLFGDPHTPLMPDSAYVGGNPIPVPPPPVEEAFSEDMGKIGTTTLRDISFRHHYCRVLKQAKIWLDRYKASHSTADLHQAWDIYHTVFKQIMGQLKTLQRVELRHVSHALVNASDLLLAIPGTYRPFTEVLRIAAFAPSVDVIASKQRPRKMSMYGSDGKHYMFLLKGKEDLRQDERVMQLFGLINICLDNETATTARGLHICRYSVLPISNNSGVIGWVQNCDTLNQLVKEYRKTKDVRLNIEQKLLYSKAPDYDKLPLIQKIDAYCQVLNETTGDDIARMLWLTSKTSDMWVERRANFTKSLAVMSMVGYILGLGDRHPSNLMIDRVTGQVVHIDFGDCFDVAINRSKFPETVPFRLTRMLIKSMEASGIEGTYRSTCEKVMHVMRDNKDSVMAMLEAFVYDPLISWRLLVRPDGENATSENGEVEDENRMRNDSLIIDPEVPPSLAAIDQLMLAEANRSSSEDHDTSGTRRRSSSIISPPALDASDLMDDSLNARALVVIHRIEAKLTGNDFVGCDELSVEDQVDKLINQATSVENLCQLFTGWCAHW